MATNLRGDRIIARYGTLFLLKTKQGGWAVARGERQRVESYYSRCKRHLAFSHFRREMEWLKR